MTIAGVDHAAHAGVRITPVIGPAVMDRGVQGVTVLAPVAVADRRAKSGPDDPAGQISPGVAVSGDAAQHRADQGAGQHGVPVGPAKSVGVDKAPAGVAVMVAPVIAPAVAGAVMVMHRHMPTRSLVMAPFKMTIAHMVAAFIGTAAVMAEITAVMAPVDAVITPVMTEITALMALVDAMLAPVVADLVAWAAAVEAALSAVITAIKTLIDPALAMVNPALTAIPVNVPARLAAMDALIGAAMTPIGAGSAALLPRFLAAAFLHGFTPRALNALCAFTAALCAFLAAVAAFLGGG